MSNIQYNQQQSTFATIALATGFIVHLCSIPLGHQNLATDKTKSLANSAYYPTTNSPTYTSMSNAMTGEFNSISSTFENVVSSFYANLLSKQEPLGGDFEKVLNDNLWDLYES